MQDKVFSFGEKNINGSHKNKLNNISIQLAKYHGLKLFYHIIYYVCECVCTYMTQPEYRGQESACSRSSLYHVGLGIQPTLSSKQALSPTELSCWSNIADFILLSKTFSLLQVLGTLLIELPLILIRNTSLCNGSYF